MPITMISRNGPPEGLHCPVVICDRCGAPIDTTTPGIIAWGLASAYVYLHKGRCDDAWCATHDDDYGLSQELDDFMAQLAHNYAHPLVEEPGVEYVAPAPSTWRLGRRR